MIYINEIGKILKNDINDDLCEIDLFKLSKSLYEFYLNRRANVNNYDFCFLDYITDIKYMILNKTKLYKILYNIFSHIILFNYKNYSIKLFSIIIIDDFIDSLYGEGYIDIKMIKSIKDMYNIYNNYFKYYIKLMDNNIYIKNYTIKYIQKHIKKRFNNKYFFDMYDIIYTFNIENLGYISRFCVLKIFIFYNIINPNFFPANYCKNIYIKNKINKYFKYQDNMYYKWSEIRTIFIYLCIYKYI